MKKAVLLLAGLLTVLSMGFASAQFSDVPAGHWAKEAVEKLAAEGIILGFPDGTFRGNENLTRYQAAMIIYRLLQKLEPGQMASMDKETITALRNAVQELAAELASLGVRVSALEDNAASKSDVARLEKMIAELKSMPSGEGASSAALKDLADRVEAAAIAADTALAQVQALQTKVDSVGAQASSNADSIKALNELAVLLNQDVLSLQDRVTKLEKSAGQSGQAQVDLTGLATKGDLQSVRDYVTAIRGDLVNVSNRVGALEANVSDVQDQVSSLSSRLDTVERNAFTISGSLALKYKSVRFSGSPFDIDRLYPTAFSTGDVSSTGEVVDDADFSASVPGQTSASLSVTFQTGELDGTSVGEGVNHYPGFFQFSIQGSLSNPYPGATIPSPTLSVDQVSTTVDIAADQSLMFTFGQTVKTKFTEYLFDNEANSYGQGIIGVFKTGVLGAQIKGVYGNAGLPGYDYFYGVHASITPFKDFTLGGSYLTQDSAPNPVYGADLSAKLGPLDVMGEFFKDSANAQSYYVKGDAQFGAFSLGANYRNIAPITAATVFSNDANFVSGSSDNSAPFRASSNGFGVNAGLKVGIFSVSGYFDNYTLAAPNTDLGPHMAAGGEVSASVGAFTLAGYYKYHNWGADYVEGAAPGGSYFSGYGISADHDGGADNALIPGLDLHGSYDHAAVSATNTIEAYAQYDHKFSILNVTALARYYNYAGTTTTKFGGKLETDPLGIVLAPSFMGGYVTRSTTGGGSETYWFGGLKFNKFLWDHSVFEGAYASYSGAGLSSMLLGSADKAFDATANYIYQSGTGSDSGTYSGYYLAWTYWDLNFAFANFGDGTNAAQAFQIKYTIDF